MAAKQLLNPNLKEIYCVGFSGNLVEFELHSEEINIFTTAFFNQLKQQCRRHPACVRIQSQSDYVRIQHTTRKLLSPLIGLLYQTNAVNSTIPIRLLCMSRSWRHAGYLCLRRICSEHTRHLPIIHLHPLYSLCSFHFRCALCRNDFLWIVRPV